MKIPSISRADVLDPQRMQSTAQRLVDAHCFRTTESALKFLEKVQRRDFSARFSFHGLDPEKTSALSDDLLVELNRSFDAIHAAYEPSGAAHPAYAASLEQQGLPLQIYQAALSRASSGKSPSFESALEEVCAELHAPMPRKIRAFDSLFSAEPEMLKKEADAAAQLASIQLEIKAARVAAVGLVNTRDRLTNNVSVLRAELSELNGKRQSICRRRERHWLEMTRSLRSGAVLSLDRMADAGAVVASFDLVLKELARLNSEKETAIVLAEKDLSDFLAKNSDAFAAPPK